MTTSTKNTNGKASTTMTKPRKVRTDYSAVKRALLAGSMLASLVGSRLLAWQDNRSLPTAPPASEQPAALQAARITIEPLTLPSMTGGVEEEPFVLDLQAIPTAVNAQPRIVRPVARSRSSR